MCSDRSLARASYRMNLRKESSTCTSLDQRNALQRSYSSLIPTGECSYCLSSKKPLFTAKWRPPQKLIPGHRDHGESSPNSYTSITAPASMYDSGNITEQGGGEIIKGRIPGCVLPNGFSQKWLNKQDWNNGNCHVNVEGEIPWVLSHPQTRNFMWLMTAERG